MLKTINRESYKDIMKTLSSRYCTTKKPILKNEYPRKRIHLGDLIGKPFYIENYETFPSRLNSGKTCLIMSVRIPGEEESYKIFTEATKFVNALVEEFGESGSSVGLKVIQEYKPGKNTPFLTPCTLNKKELESLNMYGK